MFAVKNGSATWLPGSPPVVFGVAWRKGTLYVSAGRRLLAWSKWNGSTFKRKRTIYKGGKGIPSFTGLAIGPKGRLYTGVSFTEKTEFKRSRKRPLVKTYVSIKPSGKGGLRLVAKGLRQPWMSTFVNGKPFLTVLAQDNLDPTPPDYIVSPRAGQDYGFPKCNRSEARPCRGFARPVAFFQNHASPMGIGHIGKTLYVALFNGIGAGPSVVTLRTTGGQPSAFLTGYAAPVVALGIYKGWVYSGDLSGAVYRVRG